ncbi:MAG: hypothetical protein ACI8UO_000263 [Verrucomicrobiales bacterium]|jgi:hypothetical protein
MKTQLVALLLASSSCWAQVDLILNPELETSDSHPSFVREADGSGWFAWHGYANGSDGIYARKIEANGELGEVVKFSGKTTVHSPPELTLNADEKPSLIWSQRQGGRWSIQSRYGDELKLGATLSSDEVDAIHPTAGAAISMWSELRDGRFRIVAPELEVSDGNHDAFRPAYAEGWAAWDEFDGKRYRVIAKSMDSDTSEFHTLSNDGANALNPVLLRATNGLTAAWLEKVDVIGGEGAISQMHTLQAAELHDEKWHNIEGPGAVLTQGLMAKIEPKALATGGYLGRRAAPMLLDAGDAIWLLWERKSNHSGSTPNVNGDLLGRPIRDGKWGETVLLKNGFVDYHLAEPARAENGIFYVVASDLPRNERRKYHLLGIDLNSAAEFRQDKWVGWEPVELPVQSEQTDRQSAKIEGKNYKLFWGDLHCHSGLTTDAEGEHDELIHYARDKAMLDVVVFTNNDFLYDTFLTEYEFALGNFLANTYTREGSFIALPGYEWTARVPGKPGVPFSEPSTWTPPYQNRSYPNHRSVIFPASAGPLIRFPEVANEIQKLNEAVEKSGGLTLSQHEAFLLSGHKVEVGLELTSGWRNYMRIKPQLFHGSLKPGVRLGFVANGDTHRRAPGLSGALTGIFAEELTETAILDALRERRCFATNGSRIFLDSRINGEFMGRETRAPDGVAELNLKAIGTRPILSAELIKNGETIGKFPGTGGNELEIQQRVEGLESGEHWFYWRVIQEGGGRPLPGNVQVAFGSTAWSTPVWVIVD